MWSCRYTKKTGGAGGDSYAIHMDGAALGDMLADLVPEDIMGLSLIGPLVATVLGWVPTLLFFGCIWCCCCRQRNYQPPVSAAGHYTPQSQKMN